MNANSDNFSNQWGPFDLSGVGIGLTGAGGHLGKSISKMLLASGATLVAIGRSKKTLDSLSEECGIGRGRIISVSGDIANETVISRALDILESECGSIGGWVNNAYSSPSSSAGLTFQRTEIANGLLQLENTMMVTKWVSDRMSITQEKKSIVNISSVYGVVSPDPRMYERDTVLHNPAVYGVIKSGLIQFTKYSAVHLADKNIRVNSVSPGPFPSRAIQENTEFINKIEKKVPLKRIGQPEELAGVVTFLLGNASSYITGENLMVDGGWTAW